jgi:tryptophan-rich sensory protein
MTTRFILFLIINFAALGIGSLFTGKGVPSEWYVNLNKAPWTPPGWVFGAAWTLIMVCFAIYMAYLWPLEENKKMLIGLFSFQVIFNVMWNPTFFHFQNVIIGLLVISALTVLIGYFLFHYWPTLKIKSVLIFPYFIWLLIATSLNGYILLNN